jgi:hypothetical protein
MLLGPLPLGWLISITRQNADRRVFLDGRLARQRPDQGLTLAPDLRALNRVAESLLIFLEKLL